MIIDSHAHYSHRRYTGEFSFLSYKEGCFFPSRGDLKNLLETMRGSGITLSIEPATSFDRIEDQLALVKEFAPYFRLALGIHPKHCDKLPWEDREKLRALVMEHDLVAIGETGLEYSSKPDQVDPACQKMWFRYQIALAYEKQLPLILHIRDAYGDALEILTESREILHGGVAHCFRGDYETAMPFVELGLALGIGGKLLWDDEEGRILQDTVKRVPLDAILVETDAPYIMPDIRNLPCPGKQRKKLRNTSLLLPAIIEKIAQLRCEDRDGVEEAIYRNTLRVFGI